MAANSNENQNRVQQGSAGPHRRGERNATRENLWCRDCRQWRPNHPELEHPWRPLRAWGAALAIALIIATTLFALSACGGGAAGSGGQTAAATTTLAATTGDAAATEAADEAAPAGAADEAGAAGAAGAAKQGGEFVYALATSIRSLDPHKSGMAADRRIIKNIFDTLVVYADGNQILPWLAKSWDVSEDGLTYTFHLLEGVTFHDGTPFNAEAVKYNFERVLAEETASTWSDALRPIVGTETPDEYTAVVTLSYVDPSFLRNLAYIWIASPTAAEKWGVDDFTTHPTGTGPFKFVSWEEDIVLERNPDHTWGSPALPNQGPAYLDKLVFRVISEEATRVGSIESAQVSAIETVPPQNIGAVESNPELKLFKKATEGLSYTLFFAIENEPWGDATLRRGIRAGIDVGTIVSTLYFGTYPRAYSPLTTGPYYDESLEVDLYNPEEAKALLDEAGWTVGADGIREKDGKKLSIHYIDGSPNREKRNDIAAMVKQQLLAIGVDVNVEITTDTSQYTQSNPRGFDIVGNSYVSADPAFSLRRFYFENNGLSHLNDPQVNAWLDQLASETDEAAREDLFKKVQNFIVDNAVVVPIYIYPYTVATGANVEGIVFDPLGYPLFAATYFS